MSQTNRYYSIICQYEGHDWEQIWDDKVGVRCCICLVCGEEKIFEYDPDEREDNLSLDESEETG